MSMLPLEIGERKMLRHDLMLALYEHYFETGGAALHLTKDELQGDREKDLAYQYLRAKGLIAVEQQGSQHFYMKPTAHGIDYIEN